MSWLDDLESALNHAPYQYVLMMFGDDDPLETDLFKEVEVSVGAMPIDDLIKLNQVVNNASVGRYGKRTLLISGWKKNAEEEKCTLVIVYKPNGNDMNILADNGWSHNLSCKSIDFDTIPSVRPQALF